jgi:hypothetical protein
MFRGRLKPLLDECITLLATTENYFGIARQPTILSVETMKRRATPLPCFRINAIRPFADEMLVRSVSCEVGHFPCGRDHIRIL